MELPFDLMMVKDAVLWLAPTFVLPVYCYFISQTRRNLVQHLLWIAGIIACGFIPMTVPAGNTAARWWLSLLTFAVTLKMAHGWASGARFGSINEAHFFFLQPMTEPNPRPLVDKNKPRERILRGLFKFGLLLASVFAHTTFPWTRTHVFTSTYLCMFSVYFVVTGFVDFYSGIGMWFTGWDTDEFCDAPFLATGPRDFWSRRWNMLFRNVTHACIFKPLKNLGINPLYGVAGVFVTSCVVHEYMVLVSSESTQYLGWMSSYFLLHGLATVVNTYASRNKTWNEFARKVPNPVWIVCLHVWLFSTAPLFFSPLLACIPMLEYTLF